MNPLMLAVMLVVMIAIPGAFAQSDEAPNVDLMDDSPDVVINDSPDVVINDSLDVVINEFELDPFGRDGYSTIEWVEIYNPTGSIIDIGGWTVSSEVKREIATIPINITLRPYSYFVFTNTGEWLSNTSESVTLSDKTGQIIDQTPFLTDINDNHYTWQRSNDGVDTDAMGDWIFKNHTRGYANSINSTVEITTISLDVTTDKKLYMLNDILTISGNVAGVDPSSTSFFVPPHVKITVTGQEYLHTAFLTVDTDLRYSTSLKLQKALGVDEGTYDIVATYVGSVAATSFIVGEPSSDTTGDDSSAIPDFTVRTDRISYVPGDTIFILGDSKSLIEYKGMTFRITDPNGDTVSDGIIFPSDRSHSTALRTIDADIVGDSQFGTSFFINPIMPIHGTYSIVANYGNFASTTAFEVEAVVQGDAKITLDLDRTLYILGETVSITGSMNKVWVPSLQFEVTHNQNTIVDPISSESGITAFHILESVMVQPNGDFSYEFMIPDNSNRIGRYTATVSDGTLFETRSFDVVRDIESHITDVFTVNTDKDMYLLGESIRFSGNIGPQALDSSDSTIVVQLVPNDDPASVGLLVTTLPDSAGNYSMEHVLSHNLFESGQYTAHASYVHATEESLLANSQLVGTYSIKHISSTPIYTAMTSFEIINPRDLGDVHFTAMLDSETYNFGDTVNVSGIVSVDTFIPVLTINVLNPDGKTISYTADIKYDGTFSFDWSAPTIKTDINVGTYTITVLTENTFITLPFSIGESIDSVDESMPITINVPRDLYQHEEIVEISGRVLLPSIEGAFQAAPKIVNVAITSTSSPTMPIVEFYLTPDSLGTYSVSEKISAGIFPNGPYSVSASYSPYRAHDSFSVGEHPIGIRADN